jgi:putative oxygen-independent coproporphyrinogen III oxidase
MNIPLSLYIHIPWCVKKCPYCDFNSHPLHGEIPELSYIERLIEDIEQELPAIWGRKIKTIFIGGGTPSLFSAAAFEYLFKELSSRLSYLPFPEITLEANPGTVEREKFDSFRKIGINRLSLGIQSFQDNKLMALGRIHTGYEAEKAIEAAKLAGFTNFNLDLMFGLPQQTVADALSDLKTAASYQPTHLSWYQLTIEPNTFFSKFPPTLAHEDDIWEIQEQGQAMIAAHYHQYEISAYSQQDFQCQHNRNYWEFGDYIGIGAGAHSKITKTDRVLRKSKIRHPKQYLDANTQNLVAVEKIVHADELPLEFMLNALRLYEAIPFALFEARTGLKLEAILKKLNEAEALGLISLTHESLMTTPLGKRFLNNLLEIFMPKIKNF